MHAFQVDKVWDRRKKWDNNCPSDKVWAPKYHWGSYIPEDRRSWQWTLRDSRFHPSILGVLHCSEGNSTHLDKEWE